MRVASRLSGAVKSRALLRLSILTYHLSVNFPLSRKRERSDFVFGFRIRTFAVGLCGRLPPFGVRCRLFRSAFEPSEVAHESLCFCADVPKNEHFAANIATHEENVQSSAQ